MGTLEFEKDLWAPLQPGESPPVSCLLGQTSGGVVHATRALAEGFFGDRAQAVLEAALEGRRFARLAQGGLTYREELLYMSHMTLGGLLVLKVETGGAVMSVDTWDVGDASPRALTREEARQRFAKHTIAVVVDPERITAYWHADRPKRPLRLDAMPTVVPPKHPVPEAGVDDAPSAEVRKTRALIKAAREALLPENWALRPVA